MPTILPISDLGHYTDVLNQVDVNKPVYLTRNGRGAFVITRIDDYDPDAVAKDLLHEIELGIESMKEGTSVSLAEVAKKYDVSL